MHNANVSKENQTSNMQDSFTLCTFAHLVLYYDLNFLNSTSLIQRNVQGLQNSTIFTIDACQVVGKCAYLCLRSFLFYFISVTSYELSCNNCMPSLKERIHLDINHW